MFDSISGMPNTIDSGAQDQTAQNTHQSLCFPSAATFTNYSMPISGKDKGIIPLHTSFPNSGTETTGKEEMIPTLNNTMAKNTLRVTCVAPS
jgi:hypothetical protein